MRKAFSVFIIFILFFSCNNGNKGLEEYYYAIYNEKNQIKGYVKRIVNFRETKRVDTVYRYSRNKNLQIKQIEVFTEYSGSVLKSKNNQDNYRISEKDSCYNYLSSADDTFRSCYLGKVDLTVNDVKYENAYKFLVAEQVIDGITNYKIFDDNFILIRQEYESGFLDYYRIDRVNKIDSLNNNK